MTEQERTAFEQHLEKCLTSAEAIAMIRQLSEENAELAGIAAAQNERLRELGLLVEAHQKMFESLAGKGGTPPAATPPAGSVN